MRHQRLTDQELVRRSVDHADGEAFGELYRRHVDAVLAYHRRRVPTPELALDLSAETFATAITEAHRFRGEGAVAAWLYGIARHKLLESLRRGRVEDEGRRKLEADPLIVTDLDAREVETRALHGAAALDRDLAALDVDQRDDLSELDRDMRDALAGLGDDVREALVARVVDERDYDEIAAALDCSEQLVRQRVSRGLKRLRAAMEETP